MNIIRMVGVITVLFVGYLYLLFAHFTFGMFQFFGLAPNATHWGLWDCLLATVWSLPFLFTFYLVYCCFCTEEMDYWQINSFSFRPKALKRAFLAQVVALAIGQFAMFLTMQRFTANELSTRVLLETQPPLVEMRDSGQRPQLPLTNDAVGIEARDGKFNPALFLVWPQPGWGFEDITFDLQNELPRIKVYRGTNDVAASNHFLGEFEIGGYPKTNQLLQARVSFDLSETRQLFLKAHSSKNRILELKRVDVTTGQ